MHVSKVIVRGGTIKNGLEVSKALEGGGTGLVEGLGFIIHDWNAGWIQAGGQGGQIGSSWRWWRSRSGCGSISSWWRRRTSIVQPEATTMGGGGVHVAAFGVTATVAAELGDDCAIDSDGILCIVWDVLGSRKI